MKFSSQDLMNTLGETVKFPNLLANVKNPNSIDDIDRDFSRGLLSGDASLHIQNLSLKYGYPLKKYKVVTEDGYKLTLYRIQRKGPVVFLMHGLICSADDYMTPGPKSSLAYLLADAGYDVWLGNARGNKHSRHNIRLLPSDPKFWDFSWHEIGIYDLPAMIDYVLKETRQKKLKYIGHSQGTTSFYVMASERPEYNKKISIMISLSPVAYMSHITSPFLKVLAGPGNALYSLLKYIGLYEFLPSNAVVQSLKTLLCGAVLKAEILCSNVVFLIAGFDWEQLNITNLPVIYGHMPAGAATKQIMHYAQGITSGDFKQFDYGPAENNQRYGSAQPPNPIDVEQLRGELGNVVDYHKVDYFPFNHFDFIWAKDLKRILYRHIMELLKLYN
ncbi:hypothetical protein ACJJTC_010350 [Scirpophaga incertulas]